MFNFWMTLLLSSALVSVQATPVDVAKRAAAFSTTQLSALEPFTLFAGAVYCKPEIIQNWTCGKFCDGLPGFVPTLTGGDGDAVQFFFVGHWPDQNAVVVAHQGTDPLQLESVLTDINVIPVALNNTLFPGIPKGAAVHSGFRDEHAKTATQISDEVKRLISTFNATSVITIGHSLGGALAVLDALMLRLVLPTDILVSSTTFGLPRVGESDFASFFDSKIPDFRRVNNDHDLVPTVPGRFLGYTHPQGEIHILGQDSAVSCAGTENAVDPQCTIKTVPNILDGNVLDHLGPYQGIFIGSVFC